MKNKGFGHLKNQVIYHKDQQKCRFWGPMVYIHQLIRWYIIKSDWLYNLWFIYINHCSAFSGGFCIFIFLNSRGWTYPLRKKKCGKYVFIRSQLLLSLQLLDDRLRPPWWGCLETSWICLYVWWFLYGLDHAIKFITNKINHQFGRIFFNPRNDSPEKFDFVGKNQWRIPILERFDRDEGTNIFQRVLFET